MNKEAAFDALAADYDTAFSQSLIGLQQRRISRKWLEAFLAGKARLRILEINCGTGEDAWWLASLGHEVTATDQSAAMICKAQQKANLFPQRTELSFTVCGFEELSELFRHRQFDLIFSNFSGFNCASPAMLSKLGTELQNLLSDNGHLAVVIFGKYSLWETVYFLIRSDFRKAFRRWGHKEVMVPLREGIYQPVYYYSAGRFARILHSFRILTKRPIGLFIPPSYVEGFMQRNPGVFRLLVKLEKISGRLAGSSQLADHTYILLKKESQ